MEIKAADVAKLRAMTGAGMMDCKKALQEAEGDFARAQEIIREKGKLIASKRADRTATEGIVTSKVVGNKAYMVCLACETDFVAKGDEFKAKAAELLETAIANDCADLDALQAVVGGLAAELTGKTGEKVEIPFYARIEAPLCVTYIHTNNKLGTLVGFNTEVPTEVAKDVAMQAAAMNPVSIDKADCDPAVIEQEHRIGLEQARGEGKPEAMLEKIADGKVAKFLKENTLLNQPLVKDNKFSVGQYVENAVKGATVVAYKRFSLND
ncbi:Translation elongation factor Ts [Mucinivorans hirudinis]|uniref:Elongation factor Ts n=1 Tax=Mucinivorans hirudinis TaxID=1433126 RepID=A0A060RE69_9BACT|nr:Translation elongation factor Ts [Mucinivorans hirudinis]